MISWRFKNYWARLWMRYAGLSGFGRTAARLAALFTPPFYGRQHLAMLSKQGFVSPKATIHHNNLQLNAGVFIDDRVLIYQDRDGGPVELDSNVLIYRDSIIQTGAGGSVTIGEWSSLQPRCQLSAYKGSIHIGCDVLIAPGCAFYPYDHGILSGELIRRQPLQTRGGITIDDDAWLGVGVTVLDGVRIGKGAVIGAGSIVTHDIPDDAIAVGVPARVLKRRSEMHRPKAR